MEKKSKSIAKAAFPRSDIGIRRIDIKFKAASKFEKPAISLKDLNQSLERNESIVEKPYENQQTNNNESIAEINLDRSMSRSIEDALFYYPLKRSHVNNIKSIAECSNDSSILKLSTDLTKLSQNLSDDIDLYKFNSISTKPNGKLQSLASSSKGISLKDFEMHREMLDEENRLKKEMLNKVIQNHLKKTATATRKIEEIKKELTRIDNDLAIDIALLRKKIDDACMHFANIEHHYIKHSLRKKIDLQSAALERHY